MAGEGIRGAMSALYDVFVDWPGRLGRELPGLESQLRACGARRVLDVGCGTGRHVQALLNAGFDAHGADVSEDMLARAEALLRSPERVHRWHAGELAPDSLRRQPFDALIALGNVWPLISTEAGARSAADEFTRLLKPGGLLVLGLKAFAEREASAQPYLPLLRREHEGRTLWFVRFVDFGLARQDDGVRVADLHMAILAGTAGCAAREALHHGATRVRSWGIDELARWWSARGFTDVRVAGALADRGTPARGEDVFVSAFAPALRPPGRS